MASPVHGPPAVLCQHLEVPPAEPAAKGPFVSPSRMGNQLGAGSLLALPHCSPRFLSLFPAVYLRPASLCRRLPAQHTACFIPPVRDLASSNQIPA